MDDASIGIFFAHLEKFGADKCEDSWRGCASLVGSVDSGVGGVGMRDV